MIVHTPEMGFPFMCDADLVPSPPHETARKSAVVERLMTLMVAMNIMSLRKTHTNSCQFSPLVMLFDCRHVCRSVFSKSRLPGPWIQAPLLTNAVPSVIIGAKYQRDVRSRCHPVNMSLTSYIKQIITDQNTSLLENRSEGALLVKRRLDCKLPPTVD
jgi:hypothetical protein